MELTSSALGRSFERLGSGLRINRASDDAAGLAIADSLRVSARIHGQAMRNINDGISAMHIASSTLEQQNQILERMLELATQSSNGTYSSAQRQAMGVEYRSLAEEFGRLGDSTSFNGINLLRSQHTGGSANIQIQAGPDSSANSVLTLNNADTATLSGTFDVSRIASANWDGSTLNPVINVADFSSFLNFLADIQNDGFNLIATRFQNNLLSFNVKDSSGQLRNVLVGFNYSFSGADSLSSVGIMTFVSNTSGTGYTASASVSNSFVNGGYSIDSSTGQLQNANAVTLSTSVGDFTFDLSGIRFLSGTGNSAIDFSGIETRTRALDAVSTLQSRMSELQSAYGMYGAFESRLGISLNVISAMRDNFTAAESRIRDVDVAQESANLVRLQILQKTGAAVLSHAATQHQLALQLLQF